MTRDRGRDHPRVGGPACHGHGPGAAATHRNCDSGSPAGGVTVAVTRSRLGGKARAGLRAGPALGPGTGPMPTWPGALRSVTVRPAGMRRLRRRKYARRPARRQENHRCPTRRLAGEAGYYTRRKPRPQLECRGQAQSKLIIECPESSRCRTVPSSSLNASRRLRLLVTVTVASVSLPVPVPPVIMCSLAAMVRLWKWYYLVSQ